jgi:hypothetical protein
MAPAISSARPPNMTIRVSLRVDNPAVRAKGTVSPSESPIVASDIIRALVECWFDSRIMLPDTVPVVCDSRSDSLAVSVYEDLSKWLRRGRVGEIFRHEIGWRLGKRRLLKNAIDMVYRCEEDRPLK